MAQPQEDQRGFEIGSDDIIKKGRFKADVPKEATEDDQSKVTKDSLDGGATPSSVGGCRWTKMKLGTIVLALFAVLALMIGLSVGFGRNESDGMAATSSAASSALSLTLEQCLDEESSFSKSSKSSKGSKSSPSSSKDTTSSTTATATATATAVVKVDAIDAKDEPAPTPVTPMPTYAVTAGSTPTVSTEVTGPPTTSYREEAKVRELLGRELLRGASAAQSKKVPAEKAIATWSKPRKLEGCDALLDEYYGKSGKSSSKSKSGKSGCDESGSSESDKNSKSRKSSKCKDQPTEKPPQSERPSESPSESERPSESPSESEKPSESLSPSEMPSVKPSMKPSESLSPSEKPSENPSETPRTIIEGIDEPTKGNAIASIDAGHPECVAGFGGEGDPPSQKWLDKKGEDCPFYKNPFYINRDGTKDSEFYFDTLADAPFGNGALCGRANGDTSKFTLEYFGDISEGISNDKYTSPIRNFLYAYQVDNLEDMSYDFFVKSCKDSVTNACPEQFYMSVYVRSTPTSTSPLSDCTFVYSATSGGIKGTWTTVDLSNILDKTASTTYTYPRDTDNGGCDTTSGGRAKTLREYLSGRLCPVLLTNNAYYTFSWNIGDSKDNGELEGCYDNIQFKFNGEDHRIYDFEPGSK